MKKFLAVFLHRPARAHLPPAAAGAAARARATWAGNLGCKQHKGPDGEHRRAQRRDC